MSDNTLISVIVPIYNSEKYLDRCISSIVNQTFKNLEIILINDGSVDASAEIINNWANNDKRIIAIHKDNEGDVITRNKGLDIYNGDYVIMVDNDDYMEPDMIEYLYNLCKDYSSDISRCGFYCEYIGKECDIPEYSKEITVLSKNDYDNKIIDLLESDYSSGVVWNKLYNRNALGLHRMRKEDGTADDFLLNYRILNDNPNMVISKKPLYHYLVRDDSMTGKVFTEGAFDIIKAKSILLEEFKNNSIVYPCAVRSYIISAFIVLTGCIKNDYFNNSYSELVKSIKALYPFVISCDLFSFTEKCKVFAIRYFQKIYTYLIRKKYKNK